MRLTDPLDVICLLCLGALGAAGVIVPALIFGTVLVAHIVTRGPRLLTCCPDSNPNVIGVCRNCGQYAYGDVL